MGWKALSTWVKGGLIVIIILILSYLLAQLSDAFSGIFGLVLLPFILLAFMVASILGLRNVFFEVWDFIPNPNIYGYILVLCVGFFIGAMIGLIISKIKSKPSKK